MNTIGEFTDEAIRLGKLLDEALAYLARQTRKLAEAEHDYRRAKAQAWLSQGGPDDPGNLLWVCPECHGWIHDHPRHATTLGLLKGRTDDHNRRDRDRVR